MKIKDKICIIGLGYVGLPLSTLFSSKYDVIGYDIDKKRISDLEDYYDKTNEVNRIDLKKALNSSLKLTSNLNEIVNCNIYIITVPTPIFENKKPNLNYLISATSTVAKVLRKGDIVVYESTVFPGCTEEVCVPILSDESKLSYNKDFFCGYSPERVNPGDKVHRIENIKKIVSGSNLKTLKTISKLYSSIVKAGVYEAKSIKIAEAAKVIENSQRDINIAFVNELAMIFDKMDIDTNDVLEAASTKWNFLNFKPGLVGGHCIGVDPYYLSSKSIELGYNPEIILGGRKINDYIPKHIANKINDILSPEEKSANNILILGGTFKENCPDFRNSKVIDLRNFLIEFGYDVDVYDPLIEKNDFLNEFNFNIIDTPSDLYDAIILAVAHEDFKSLDINSLKSSSSSIIFDIKGFLPRDIVSLRL
jgi:UDP-N-acetyl-D-galactosamine dehydrogenase